MSSVGHDLIALRNADKEKAPELEALTSNPADRNDHSERRSKWLITP